MKLLTSTALFLLLISLASVSYAQSYGPYDLPPAAIKLRAEAGWAKDQFYLGILYNTGRGFDKDIREAIRWYRLSAEPRNAVNASIPEGGYGYVEAQLQLGLMYAQGFDVPEDYIEGIKWYRLAVKQGNVMAQVQLANMYRSGKGVPQNNIRAYMWYSLAHAQGDEAKKAAAVNSELLRVNRNNERRKLSPSQLLQGQEMARRCFESDFQDCE
jgi:TPR repeat protein